MIDIDRFHEILDELFQQQPECCLDELNGGVCLLPESKLDEQAVDDDLYVLGEFCYSGTMGRYINIYYGSFCSVFEDLTEAELTEEIQKVLQHEIYHHLESLSGTHELEDEDDLFMEQYLASKKETRRKEIF